MRILFASDYAHIPENTGGLEVNTHELSLALLEAGHEPVVLAVLLGRGWTGLNARLHLRLRRRGGWAADHGLGYPVLRAWNPSAVLDDVITHCRPDVVVVQSWRLDMVAAALRRGCGVVLYSHSANSTYVDTIGGTWARRCVLLANSQFNARFQAAALGVAFEVLHPLVRPEHCLAKGRRGHVLQIGISRRKGAHLTVAIARARPDIPFVLVRTWEGLRAQADDLAIMQEANSLANIRLAGPQRDPRRLYRSARILLVPSTWAETWGRVVTEAQLNGIPVLASNRGGLPESVGDGGILLDPDGDLACWIEAVGRLWDDPRHYAETAERARRRAARQDVAPAGLQERFIAALEAARRRSREGDRREAPTLDAGSA
jgi:glycosyltransferase involved in cell wall biosynthesis